MLAMIVDDSRAMRQIIGRILKEVGFSTTEAGDGNEALSMLEAGPVPNVVLVDWNMPGMNGLDFVKSVRARAKFDDLPLVMVTTEAESERIQNALDCGAQEYVMKPFTPEGLRSRLELAGVGVR